MSNSTEIILNRPCIIDVSSPKLAQILSIESKKVISDESLTFDLDNIATTLNVDEHVILGILHKYGTLF
jgi:hypothetical protein